MQITTTKSTIVGKGIEIDAIGIKELKIDAIIAYGIVRQITNNFRIFLNFINNKKQEILANISVCTFFYHRLNYILCCL